MPFGEVMRQLLSLRVGPLRREEGDSVIDHSAWQCGIQAFRKGEAKGRSWLGAGFKSKLKPILYLFIETAL
jgi:hypothetical protein